MCDLHVQYEHSEQVSTSESGGGSQGSQVTMKAWLNKEPRTHEGRLGAVATSVEDG